MNGNETVRDFRGVEIREGATIVVVGSPGRLYERTVREVRVGEDGRASILHDRGVSTPFQVAVVT